MMEQLKDDMLAIHDKKITEANQMVSDGLEGEIAHSILLDEIKDAAFVIKAIEDEDTYKINSVHVSTTSNSIYEAINEYNQKQE